MLACFAKEFGSRRVLFGHGEDRLACGEVLEDLGTRGVRAAGDQQESVRSLLKAERAGVGQRPEDTHDLVKATFPERLALAVANHPSDQEFEPHRELCLPREKERERAEKRSDIPGPM